VGVPDPHRKAVVGFERWADVPAVEAMGQPGFTVGGFLMGDDANARRGKGRSVEIEMVVELGPGRHQAGVQS
jgi:hypothetical protein